MKPKRSNNYQIIINDNYGEINNTSINVNEQNESYFQKLEGLLEELVDDLEKQSDVPKVTKMQIQKRTKRMIADLESGTVTKRKLNNFNEYLKNIMPEMQLTATISGLISTFCDVI